MNLREQAEADNEFLLEDATNGFGVAIRFTKPNPSVAVAAILSLSVAGTNATVLASNLRWKIGDFYYRQAAAVTIAGGVAVVSVVAEVAGADSNQDDGAVLTVLPLVGVSAASVAATTRLGVDRLPDVVYNVIGQHHRVSVDVDPGTGQTIAGKKSAVTVRTSRFPANGLPGEGWQVDTTDISGNAISAKITIALPDLTAGRITCLLKR